MWRDYKRTTAADGKVYVGGVGGTYGPFEGNGRVGLTVGMRLGTATTGAEHLGNPIRPAETLFNSPLNLTRVIFYMVPGPPAYSYLRKNCLERWKAGGICIANQCPADTTYGPSCAEEKVFRPGC